VLEAMRGNFGLARELVSEGARALDEAGLKVWAANTAQERFLIESLAGTPEAATGVLMSSYETFEQMGEKGFRSTIAGFLAHALLAQGEYEESARFSRMCEDAAAPDDALSQMLWRRARARLAAHEGDLGRAEALAREAVQLSAKTDLLNDLADARVDLAGVLALCGRRAEALAEIDEAVKCYERKGNIASLERAQGLAAELSAPLPSGLDSS
jgi:tetratricopeptide (TPR) repeat protein